jgi:hypothetical protein
MAHPFTAFPTLGDFITRATSQGCKLRYSSAQQGAKGAVVTRYLVRADGTFAILPDMADGERLGPTELGSLCRVLDVKGYEHCFP